MGRESSSQHRCHRSVQLQSTELGQWPGADSFLTASVCMGVMNHLQVMATFYTVFTWFGKAALLDTEHKHI